MHSNVRIMLRKNDVTMPLAAVRFAFYHKKTILIHLFIHQINSL
jgi:hypothetical protein